MRKIGVLTALLFANLVISRAHEVVVDSGAGYNRSGGTRLNYELKSNKNIWLGFNVSASMAKQSLQQLHMEYRQWDSPCRVSKFLMY